MSNKISRKQFFQSGTVYVSKFRDLDLPWNPDIGKLEVLVNGVTNHLKEFSRQQIQDEIIRCQEIWAEPVSYFKINQIFNYLC